MQRYHTYKIAVSNYQGRCEQRSEVFVKILKKKKIIYFFFFGGGGGGGVFVKIQSGCERRIEVFVKIKKKKKNFFFWGGGGVRLGVGGSGWGGLGGGVRDVNEELKFLGKFKKKKNFFLGGGGSGGGVRMDVNQELKVL